MTELEIRIQTHPNFQGLELPRYQSEHASGFDLVAACDQDIILRHGEWQLVPTGLSIELPAGHEAQVRPRSGLAARHGVTLLNSPGTIDADYRGELRVIVINHGKDSFTITRGMRIAQMVIAKVVKTRLVAADTLNVTARGSGGFGHTGI